MPDLVVVGAAPHGAGVAALVHVVEPGDPAAVGLFVLGLAVGAEAQKASQSLQMLEKKLNKAIENKNDTAYNQLANLKEKLFPTGVLQERVDNLLSYQTNNPDFIQHLVEAFQPFAHQFNVLQED